MTTLFGATIAVVLISVAAVIDVGFKCPPDRAPHSRSHDYYRCGDACKAISCRPYLTAFRSFAMSICTYTPCSSFTVDDHCCIVVSFIVIMVADQRPQTKTAAASAAALTKRCYYCSRRPPAVLSCNGSFPHTAVTATS